MRAGDGVWHEVGDRVFVRRYREWDLSVGLVVGDDRCLVVDTRADEHQGAELAAAVRELTPLPWTVLVTHHHFDHCLGLPAFLPCEAWAHQRCPARMRSVTDAAVLPSRSVPGSEDIDLGGRRVEFVHFGPAHTDNDVVAHVPDTGVLFAGDLVEHVPGGSFSDESFDESTDLAHWPEALDGILALQPRLVVPGHGEPVDPGFVAAVREPLAALARLRRACDTGWLTVSQALEQSPFSEDVTRSALM